jgi:hypothetical protein
VSAKKTKERERFYLLPGQGGRNFRSKQKVILAWTVVVALVFGGLLAVLIWWFSRPMH